MCRAVVSGITGHVGQELTRQLVSAGVEVHGLTRKPAAARPRFAEGVKLHLLDGETDSLVRLFGEVKPDTVIHLAALARREHRSEDVTPFIQANILFGAQLLEAARRAGCRRFIAAGSYLQHRESGECRAFNLYAATKQAFEDLLAYYVDAFGFSAAILTLCNIYGEHETRPTLLTDIAAAWLNGVPLNLHAEEAWVDLVHVEDVAAAFAQAVSLLERDAASEGSFRRYSVSSGRGMTAGELVELFERLGEHKLMVRRGEQRHPPRRVKPWRGETVPGWQPQVSLEDGIARICRTWQARQTAAGRE